MTVKIRVPPGKGPGDVLQLTLPQLLLDPNFRQIQAVRWCCFTYVKLVIELVVVVVVDF